MGIRFRCPSCTNKMHVKDFLAGKRGICPKCRSKVEIPLHSEGEFAESQGDADLEALPPPGGAASSAAQAPIATAPTQTPTNVTPGPFAQPGFGAPAAQPAHPAQQPFTRQAEPNRGAASGTQPTTPQPGAPQQPGYAMPNAQPGYGGAAQPGFTGAAYGASGPGAQPVGPYSPVPQSPARMWPVQRPTPQFDPFAEAPTAQWYVRHATGQQYGPAPAPMFQKWLMEGRIPGDGMVWREGWPDWQTAAGVFPQLLGALGGGLAPPPVAAVSIEANPFEFGGARDAASPAVKLLYQRRDGSQAMIMVSIILFILIMIGGGILIYVLTKKPHVEEDEGETVSQPQRPAIMCRA